MKTVALSFLVTIGLSLSLVAQSNDPVLLTINGKPLVKSEFEYVYNKNNSSNSLDRKSLNEYVDLFVNFKLKVEEATALGLDTTASFINELAGYRSQLTKPYLTDSKVDEDILLEAYNRMKEDVEVSHILILIGQKPSAADTLVAWNKIQRIKARLDKGEDFSKLAKELSEDPSAKQNGGNIGWITPFRTVYPFETMAYSTPIGKISTPVRTAFGYHVLKVTGRRQNQGEVLAAHIMRFTSNDDAEQNEKAKITIDSIYKRLEAGDDFAQLAVKFSEDQGSAVKNGELPWFSVGRMVPEFEKVAFAIKNIGGYSQPFQTVYGWHIVKLINKRPLASFESLKADIESKVKYDERANKGEQAFVENLKEEYNFKLNSAKLDMFVSVLGNANLSDSIFSIKVKELNDILCSFAGKSINQKEFADFLLNNTDTQKSIPSEIITEKFNKFISKKILDYEDTQLEAKHQDFRFLMQEYHDGILLFEISNNEVWDKASKDEEGLEKFFKANKFNYSWDNPHFKGYVVECKDKKTLKTAKSLSKKCHKDSLEKCLYAQLNDSIQYVKVEKGLYVKGENKIVDNQIFKSKEVFVPSEKFPYVFVVGKTLKKMPENFTDVRGLVIVDYQEYLEKEWIKKLRTKYPVVINNEVLETINKN
jgi:peptidyl-prolyl cis-trans isomerase SurA